jgi:hypothetical protein
MYCVMFCCPGDLPFIVIKLSYTKIVLSPTVSEINLVKGRKEVELVLGLDDGLKED